MTVRLIALLGFLAAVIAAGCANTEVKRNDPADFSGTAKFANGNPVKDVTLLLQPTAREQLPGTAQLKADGKFTMKLIPGKYTFMFEGKGASLKAIPEAYHQNDSNHTVEVVAGQEVTVTVN